MQNVYNESKKIAKMHIEGAPCVCRKIYIVSDKQKEVFSSQKKQELRIITLNCLLKLYVHNMRLKTFMISMNMVTCRRCLYALEFLVV